MRKVLVIILFFSLSCERGLDLEPKMYISAEEAFSNRENVLAAITGCYDALQFQHYYGRNFIIVGDMLSDNSIAAGTKIEYYSTDDNSLLADNILVEGIWQDIYSAINRVNYTLYKIGEIDFLAEDEAEDLTGQLSFLRALHYFNLVRLYGDLPLKLSPTLEVGEENYLPREDAAKVFDRIEADLETAISSTQNTSVSRATVSAAKTLLALLHLTRGSYEDAYDLASQVFTDDPYLEEGYENLFSSSGEPSREILFYVPFNANDKNRLAEYHLPNQLGGRNENAPSEKLAGLLEARDARKDMIVSTFNGRSYTRKYSDLVTGSDRVVVLRNTENLFIMAEASYFIDSIGREDEILSYLNMVRSRAQLDTFETVPAGGLWDLIQRERQIEFAFEGKRWFDLLRTGETISEVATVNSLDQLLLPIPLSEILANPEININDQNPGY